MAPRSDGDWRTSDDYRAVNQITAPGRSPISHIQGFTTSLHSLVAFSKMDLVDRNPVESIVVLKTAIDSPFGLFTFVRMPFGLGNAAIYR